VSDDARTHDSSSLDPHTGRSQFGLLAVIGLAMFVGFGALALTGASTRPQGTAYLSALSLLGLSIAWFYGDALRSRPKGLQLAAGAHVPARTVLPPRALDVQATTRRGLWFVLAFFSSATLMFLHLAWWIATRSSGAHTVGAYVSAVLVSLFSVITAGLSVSVASALRAGPKYGKPGRVERWCRVLEVVTVAPAGLDAGSRTFVLDDPQGRKPLKITVQSYESSPWIVSNHALVVFAPGAEDEVELVREDGSPFALTRAELEAMNASLDEPRNYRS
jgi:hypothetical protein